MKRKETLARIYTEEDAQVVHWPIRYNAFLAGFEKAREMAKEVTRVSDDILAWELETEIAFLGEEEVPESIKIKADPSLKDGEWRLK